MTLMREAGMVVRTAQHLRPVGMELVRARLAPTDGSAPRLLIHARCTTLIESMERFHDDPNKPESDNPVKGDGFDHACDALRYLVQNLDLPVKSRAMKYASRGTDEPTTVPPIPPVPPTAALGGWCIPRKSHQPCKATVGGTTMTRHTYPFQLPQLIDLPGGGSHETSPSRAPSHHRTLDHSHSRASSTSPRSTGLRWM